MTITRKSLKLAAFIKEALGVDADVSLVPGEKVSLGYRHVKRVDANGDEIMDEVEVVGHGEPAYSVDWLDEWGPPPGEGQLDEWAAYVPAEPLVLTVSEKALAVKELVDAAALKLYGEAADKLGVDEAAELFIARLGKAVK